MTTIWRAFPPDAVVHAAQIARLPLDRDRLDQVCVVLGHMYALIDQLDELSLGETPPAVAFDARWEG